MLGKIEGRRRRGQQSMIWLGGITDTVNMRFSKFRDMVKDREDWRDAVHGLTKSDTTEHLNNSNENKHLVA